MRFPKQVLIYVSILVLFGISGCTPHTNPLAGWIQSSPLDIAPVHETIKQDAKAYFQTLPPLDQAAARQDVFVTYWVSGDGQYAVRLESPHDGESWKYALFYGQEGKRIKVIKYLQGSYQS